MRFPQAAHMPDDGGESAPVWARRSSRGGGGNPLIGLIFAFLALLGALVIGLAIWQKSFAAAGEKIDGWIAPVTSQFGKITGRAGSEAEEAADAAGEAAQAAGDAAKAAGDEIEEAGDAAKK